jgi:hypothetical protein
LQFDLQDLGGCPETCTSPNICSYYESQAAGDSSVSSDSINALVDACNGGTLSECAPSILSGACGLCDGGLLASFVSAEEVDMICSSCDFLSCCDGGAGFDVCGENLPEGIMSGTGSTVSTSTVTGSTDSAVTTAATSVSTTAAATTTFAMGERSTVSPTPSPMDEALVPTPFPSFGVNEEVNIFNETAGGLDDFLGGLLGGFNSSSEGPDDLIGGIFGQFNESGSDGSGDFFGSIGDFIGGLFGEGGTEGFNYTSDDDWVWESAFNQSSDDFLEGIFGDGGAFNESNGSGGGLSDILGGLIEGIGNLSGVIFGGMHGDNGTNWIDKGNFSGWGTDDMFGSSLVCSEENTCPVEGFCDCMSGELSKCSLTLFDDVCSSGAVFSCASAEFEEMCNSECPLPSRQLQGGNVEFTSLSTSNSSTSPNCSMCEVARCCESEGSSVSKCAMEAGLDPQGLSNLTSIGTVLGEFIEEVLNNVTSVLDELISNVTIPEFCPSGSCPVDGFCDCARGDFTECNEQVIRDACETNAFYGECGPEKFEKFCSTECGSEGITTIQDIVNTALCSMCTIASCCRDKGSSDECIFGGGMTLNNTVAEFVTNTSGSYDGNQSVDTGGSNGVSASFNEVVSDITYEETTPDNNSAETDVASATVQEENASDASRVRCKMVVFGVSAILLTLGI